MQPTPSEPWRSLPRARAPPRWQNLASSLRGGTPCLGAAGKVWPWVNCLTRVALSHGARTAAHERGRQRGGCKRRPPKTSPLRL